MVPLLGDDTAEPFKTGAMVVVVATGGTEKLKVNEPTTPEVEETTVVVPLVVPPKVKVGFWVPVHTLETPVKVKIASLVVPDTALLQPEMARLLKAVFNKLATPLPVKKLLIAAVTEAGRPAACSVALKLITALPALPYQEVEPLAENEITIVALDAAAEAATTVEPLGNAVCNAVAILVLCVAWSAEAVTVVEILPDRLDKPVSVTPVDAITGV